MLQEHPQGHRSQMANLARYKCCKTQIEMLQDTNRNVAGTSTRPMCSWQTFSAFSHSAFSSQVLSPLFWNFYFCQCCFDTKFIIIWWFTYFCQKLLSLWFTHLFRQFVCFKNVWLMLMFWQGWSWCWICWCWSLDRVDADVDLLPGLMPTQYSSIKCSLVLTMVYFSLYLNLITEFIRSS